MQWHSRDNRQLSLTLTTPKSHSRCSSRHDFAFCNRPYIRARSLVATASELASGNHLKPSCSYGTAALAARSCTSVPLQRQPAPATDGNRIHIYNSASISVPINLRSHGDVHCVVPLSHNAAAASSQTLQHPTGQIPVPVFLTITAATYEDPLGGGRGDPDSMAAVRSLERFPG